MPAEVVMPQMGITVTQGTITKWFKKEGDPVSKGEPLLEVMTEKVTTQIESPAEGVLAGVLYRERQSVPVGTVVALIATPGEDPVQAKSRYLAAVAPEVAQVTPLPAPGPVPSPALTEERVKASPAARRVARELGIDLSAVPGTGPEGRITEQDVRAAAARDRRPRMATPLAEVVAADRGVDLGSVVGTGPGGKVTKADVLRKSQESLPGGKRVGLEGRRRVIAERMFQSSASTAPVTLTIHADMTRCQEMRELLLPVVEERAGVRLTYTDIIVKVAALALREFPALNASLAGEEIVFHGRVNVGVAVDAAEGLLVPVIPDADRKGLEEIARWRSRLAQAARSGQISPDELVGGTFTVTNLGSYGIEAFSPIINLPEAAILGVGAIKETPVASSGQVAIRPVCCLSLVFDHRLVDGGPAARFLRWIASRLENPYLLLV